MQIEFNLKEYLDEKFSEMKSDIKEIKDDLKDHRKVEEEIKSEVNILKTKMNWLVRICGVVGTGLIVGIIKQFFFT